MTQRTWSTHGDRPQSLADLNAALGQANAALQEASRLLTRQTNAASVALREAFTVPAELARAASQARAAAEQLQNQVPAVQLAELAELLTEASRAARNPRRLRGVLRRLEQRRDNLHAGLSAIADSLTELVRTGQVLLAAHRQQTRCRRHRDIPTERCALLALNLAPHGPPAAAVLTATPAHGPP